MMEENNEVFLAGGDALVYLAEPIHKKYSATFASSDPFSTYPIFQPPSPCTYMYTFYMTPRHSPSCVRT